MIATGTPRIFIWSTNGASVWDVPIEDKDFNVDKVKWNPDGKSILIQDRSHLLVAYPHFTFLQDNAHEGEDESESGMQEDADEVDEADETDEAYEAYEAEGNEDDE